MEVRWFETNGFAELLAGGFTVTGLQQSVGEVLVDIGATGRERRSFAEERDGCVIVVGAQGIEGFGKRFVRRVFSGVLSQRGGGNQAQRCKSNRSSPLV
jgi:hypothetical protein